MSAAWRFALFCGLVLALPAVIMAAGRDDPRLVDLGKLALILGPGVLGLALNDGLGWRGAAKRPAWIGLAALVTLAITAGAFAAGIAAGGVSFDGTRLAPQAAAAALGATALTSVLEELGWSGGGLALAVKALGRRWGLVVLGLVWAAWHLVPTVLRIGLFPELEAAPAPMLAAFIAACLVYRTILAGLAARAGTWIAAAAAHAAPNLLAVAFLSAGAVLMGRPGDWPWFPAPGGLVFLALAALAAWGLARIGSANDSRGADA